MAAVLGLWLVLYVIFFSFYSKILSEYYLHGMNLVWIIIISLFFARLLKKNVLAALVVGLIFTIYNVHKLTTYHNPANGYVYRKALTEEIKKDAGREGFRVFLYRI